MPVITWIHWDKEAGNAFSRTRIMSGREKPLGVADGRLERDLD